MSRSWNLGSHHVAQPIVQGGMGVGVSLSGLAAAVAREGGVGVIAAVGLTWLELEERADSGRTHGHALKLQISRAREKAQGGVIGVNVMMALSNAEELMIAAAEGGVDALFLGAGLPLALPAPLLEKGCGVALVPIVSSGRAARLIRDTWLKKYHRLPDGFVVEGPLAGGHLGFKHGEIESEGHTLQVILADVLEVAREHPNPIPVIAGGGVFSASDVRDILSRGATAVQLGTRFVATHECDASLEFKESYICSTMDDIRIIPSPVGLPGRAIRSPFLDKVTNGERPRVTCRYRCLRSCNPASTPYCIAKALISARDGDFEQGFAFCGANAHRINKIVSVKELMGELLGESTDRRR
jgi:nitronate monooxygenase